MHASYLLAALIFFTRLPFWKVKKDLPPAPFKHIVPYWPMTGWITGGTMAAVLWLAAQVLPLPMAWILAIATRLILTGCLHEDGLADFCDGFGGSRTREDTLAIMKDSHIGSYGVIGLVLYFLLLTQAATLPLPVLCTVAFCADSWSKACASQLVNRLPYARKEEESKARVVYDHMTTTETCLALTAGALPLFLLPDGLCMAAICPALVFIGLCRLMKQRLQGYTGDCCGATFLLCELSFYLGSLMLYYLNH